MSIRNIMATVSVVDCVTIKAIRSKTRRRTVVQARQAVWYLARCAGFTYGQISQHTNGAHHSSIMYGCAAYAVRTGLPITSNLASLEKVRGTAINKPMGAKQ